MMTTACYYIAQEPYDDATYLPWWTLSVDALVRRDERIEVITVAGDDVRRCMGTATADGVRLDLAADDGRPIIYWRVEAWIDQLGYPAQTLMDGMLAGRTREQIADDLIAEAERADDAAGTGLDDVGAAGAYLDRAEVLAYLDTLSLVPDPEGGWLLQRHGGTIAER